MSHERVSHERVSHEVVRTRGGALAMRSVADGEVMHPGVGPLVEAERLHIRRCAPRRAAERGREPTLRRVRRRPGRRVQRDRGARGIRALRPWGAARLELVSFGAAIWAALAARARERAAAFGWRGEPAEAARVLLARGAHETARTSCWRSSRVARRRPHVARA